MAYNVGTAEFSLETAVPVFVLTDSRLPNLSVFKYKQFKAVIVFYPRNHIAEGYVPIVSPTLIPRVLRSTFPGLTPYTAECIEVHDDVLQGPALWSVTVMVDNTTFKFERLFQLRPMIVKYSNLQKWSASRILPKGKLQCCIIACILYQQWMTLPCGR